MIFHKPGAWDREEDWDLPYLAPMPPRKRRREWPFVLGYALLGVAAMYGAFVAF